MNLEHNENLTLLDSPDRWYLMGLIGEPARIGQGAWCWKFSGKWSLRRFLGHWLKLEWRDHVPSMGLQDRIDQLAEILLGL